MSTSRLETILGLLAQNPADSFLRYGLAMEYKTAGNLEAAVTEFRSLIANDPDYGSAYFHGGQALERLGRVEEARDLYRKGIEVTTRKGDFHARDELQAALELLD